MSQSPEKAAEEHENALHFGRCPICDGIKCNGLEGSCTCCERCGNFQNRCVCCKHCKENLQICKCSDRIINIWDRSHFCGCCPDDYDEILGRNEPMFHQKGEQCPSCCLYCKEFKPDCTCCKKCGTTPCICCTICGDLCIKCKCWSARILSHFMRRSVHYHQMELQLHVCPCPNTAALLVVNEEY